MNDILERVMRGVCDLTVSLLLSSAAVFPALLVTATMGTLLDSLARAVPEPTGLQSVFTAALPVAYLLGGATVTVILVTRLLAGRRLSPRRGMYYTSLVGIVLAGIGVNVAIFSCGQGLNVAPSVIVALIGMLLAAHAIRGDRRARLEESDAILPRDS